MKQQRVMFTALPHGVGPGGHRLSVLVSPRLETNEAPPTLAKWLDFVSWPQTVAGFEWKLRFGGSPDKVPATPSSPAPQGDLWTALFPADDTFVRSYKFGDHMKGFDKLPVLSFPSAHVHSFLKETYLEFASSSELPAVSDLLGAYDPVRYLGENEGLGRLDTEIKKVEGELADKKAIPHKQRAPTKDFAQALLFHRPASKPTGDPDHPYTRVPRPFDLPELDFHQALSMLGEHPQLERLLGIVVDLEFTPPAGVGGNDEVWVVPEWDSAMGSSNKPLPAVKTRCRITPTSFVARPRASNPDLVSGGLLRLNDDLPDGAGKYELIQVDHDGAAIKVVAFANDLKRGQLDKHKTTDTPTEEAPPSFRSGGLSIVRTERAKQIHLKLVATAAMNKNLFADEQPTVLSAEDITRGYAYDAYDVKTGQWYSLCEREGIARFTGPATPIEVSLSQETGWVSLAAPQSADGHDDRLRIHESIANWGNNWSMVAPRPGKTVSPDEEPVVHQPNPTDFKLEVSYHAPGTLPTSEQPGTLPPQRFGREYYLRARAVDLAGNSAPVDIADNTGFNFALGPERYGRFDPISPPTIVMRELVSEAESPERMVIRSNYATPPGNTVANERHVFPPSIDQVRAEILGAFDTPAGVDPDAYDVIVARQGGFGDTDENGDFIHPDAQPDPNNYGAPYYDVDIPEWAVENGELARMPSLPDPLARGAAFRGLPQPGEPNQVDLYPFEGDVNWPDTLPFRIRIFESPTFVAPVFDAGFSARLLQVGLPKAEVFRVRMSSHLGAPDLELMGLWVWLQEAGLGSGDLLDEILFGQHWGFTPGRTLTFTHAVRQPLVPTEFDVLVLRKAIGDTFVVLEDRLHTSRKSTERIDIRASWTEVSDFVDPETDVWEPEKGTDIEALAFQKPVELGDPDNLLNIAERHELRHTRHVPEVEYRTIATTRFKEYFVDRKEIEAGASNPTLLDSQWTGPAAGTAGVVPESETVQSTDGATTYRRGVDYSMNYQAGEITRQASISEDVKVSYLVPPITREDSEPEIRRVLSSARPDSPRVLYAVPNFKWGRSLPGETPIRHTREGGSLRVYMDRPWWSSGAGELLGVVIWPSGGPPRPAPPPRLRPFVTARAQDPVWLSSPQPSVLPAVEDFTNRVEFEEGEDHDHYLEEVPGVPVAVAGHAVAPDHDRRLWFCDIDISPETGYFPFIRLALARFQPHSVRDLGADPPADVALSRVVLLDYMQLAPDRFATVTFNPFSPAIVAVSVSGYSYREGEAGPGPSVMEVTVERRRPEMPDGDDEVGWVAVADLEPTELEAQPDSRGGTTWSGSLTLPGARGSERLRLAIREFEVIPVGKNQLPGGGLITNRRLVYLDTIEI